MSDLLVRAYGSSGPTVVLVHGGPGAAGYLAPVGRELADSFRVLEPFQRGSGAEPLTVARHVADLHPVVANSGSARPALVGHSWGAMLVLAYAAEHPDCVAALVLVGCGTFDPIARERMRTLMLERMDDGLRPNLENLAIELPNADEQLRKRADLLLPLYSHKLMTRELEVETCDAAAHQQSWADMLRLQREGVYPAAFSAIRAPVLMLHGGVDPHPGPLIRASLQPYLPQLEYRQWEGCGHYPWLERDVHQEFFAVLREWLWARHVAKKETPGFSA